MADYDLINDYLKTKQLELLKDLTQPPKKEEQKKEEKKEKKWYEKELSMGGFFKAFVIAVFLYPIVGFAYFSLIKILWNISVH